MDRFRLFVTFLWILAIAVPATMYNSAQTYKITKAPFDVSCCVKVKDVYNKFTDAVSLGGAGGLGNTQVECYTFDQLKELAKGNTIYYSVQPDQISFVAVNNSIAYVYTYYAPNPDRYYIDHVEGNKIYFHKCANNLAAWELLVTILWLIVLAS